MQDRNRADLQVGGIMISNHVKFVYIKDKFQWALERQINIKLWSVTWLNIDRPNFDILLRTNCKYHMDINTYGQYYIKNMSRK